MAAPSRRLGWSVLAQCVSSASTALFSVLAARQLSGTEFGLYAVAFSVYIIALGVSQAIVGQIFLIFHASGQNTDAEHRAHRDGIFLAGFAGILLAGPVGIVGMTASCFPLVVLAVTLPVLLAQDAIRFVLNSKGRPRATFINDVARILLLLLLYMAIQRVGGVISSATMIGLWGVTALVALGVGLGQAHIGLGGAVRPIAFYKKHVSVSSPMIAQYALGTSAQQGAALLVASIAGVVAAGGIRGAQTLLGPVNMMSLGAVSFVIPYIAQHADSSRRVVRISVGISGVLALIAVVVGSAMASVPPHVGAMVLGDSWAASRAVLVPTTVYVGAVVAGVGPSCIFRAFRQSSKNFLISCTVAPLQFFSAVVGTSYFGVVVGVWALAISTVMGTVMSWLMVPRVLRNGVRAEPDGEIT